MVNHEEHEVHEGKVFDDLSRRVIGCAIEVHRELGPGLLESAYRICLGHELGQNGIGYESEVKIPVTYKGVALDCGYRADLVVEGILLLELKSIKAIEPVHEAQLLTYLKLANLNLGLLMNFNVPVLKDGLRRYVL